MDKKNATTKSLDTEVKSLAPLKICSPTPESVAKEPEKSVSFITTFEGKGGSVGRQEIKGKGSIAG
jgi:hypothetical protein